MRKPMTSKEIATIHVTNEVCTFLMEMWERVYCYERDNEGGTIPLAMSDLRKAIDDAQDYVLANTKGIKIY